MNILDATKFCIFNRSPSERHKSSICLFPQPIYKNIWQGCIFMCDFEIDPHTCFLYIFGRNLAMCTLHGKICFLSPLMK